MFTSIIYSTYRTPANFLRCHAPDDQIPEPKKFCIASFQPAYSTEGYSFNPSTLTTGTKHKIKRPDTAYCGSMGFHFERGIASKVRFIDPEFVRQLDEIDQQIAALQQRQREIAEEAYIKGKPVKLKQAKEWRAADIAKRTAEKGVVKS